METKTEVFIRLLHEWDNAGTLHLAGKLFKLDEKDAEELIKDGIAELYEPSAKDIVIEDPTGVPNLKSEDIETVMRKVLDEKEKAQTHEENGIPVQLRTGGYMNIADFAQDVYKATTQRKTPERMQKWSNKCKAFGLQEAMGHDGGFLVPTEFKNQLMRNLLEDSFIMNRCRSFPMSSSSLKIPIVQETTHSGSVYGGVVIYKVAEAGSKTASQPVFGQVELNLHKYVGLCYATEEMLEDSPISVEPMLTDMYTEALRFQLEDDIIFGTGAGECLGISNANAMVSVARNGAGVIAAQDVTSMWMRVMARSQGRAIWLANHDCFDQLARMTIGTTTHPIGLLQYNTSGIAAAPYATLMGRPLFLTEHAQTKGTEGDLICADFSQYLLAQKSGGVKAATSIHLKFLTDEVAFRFVMRVDGQPWMQAPLNPLRGSNTLSPFVQLTDAE